MFPRGGGDPGEQPAAADRDHHRVQTGQGRADLVEQGSGARRDERMVVRVAGQRPARGGELPAGVEGFGVPLAHEPYVGPVAPQPLHLHARGGGRQEHGGGHGFGAGRPGAGEAGVATGGDGDPGGGEGPGGAVGGEEVAGTAGLEGAGVLEVLQGVRDPPPAGITATGRTAPAIRSAAARTAA